MKALALRTQLVLVIIFVQLYAVGAGVSFWIQSRAHARLEESLRVDLTVLASLPRLRDRLRQLDAATNDYLLTGNADWLEKRRESLERIRLIETGVSALVSDGREREIFKKMDRLLASYLGQQNQWVARKEAGRLSRAEAEQLSRRPGIMPQITELLVSIKDVNVGSLEERARGLRRAALTTLILILTTGLAAGGLIAFFLARYMVGPVAALARYAREWGLGRDWTLRPSHASAEIEDLLGCLTEMTARLNLQYQKEHELVEFKTRLVSMVSHEFNNALSIISGVGILLKETEGASLTPKRRNYFSILESNIRSLALASGNLMDMGRLESGRFAVKPRRADLGPILGEAAARLALLGERKELQVTLDLPAGPVVVHADPEALGLVATNLIGNAIKYTPDKGRLTVGVEKEGDAAVRVYFQDTGIGISPDDQEKILAGYYRTETGKKTAKGFGVGLALANSIIEAHGSSLKIESEPGKGSRFSFTLPLSKDPR